MNYPMQRPKPFRDNPDRIPTSDDGDWVAGIWFVAGMILGCFGWAWIFDSKELSAPARWLGQGVTISTCIIVVSATALISSRSRCRWKRSLKGQASGVALILAVWGTTAIAAYWRGPNFATGAWCAALGGFGFLGHKLQQPTRAGLMVWVFGLFFLIGIVTMYASVAG